MRHERFADKLTAALTLCFAIMPAASAVEPATKQNVTPPATSENPQKAEPQTPPAPATPKDSSKSTTKPATGTKQEPTAEMPDKPETSTDKPHEAQAIPNTAKTQPHENPAPSTSQPKKLVRSTEPTVVGPQLITCSHTGEHIWPTSGGTDPLHWKEEVVDDGCVLTLISGTVPENPIGNSAKTGVPWANDNVTKAVVNDGVKLSKTGGAPCSG